MAYIHPAPHTGLFLGTGDRLGAVMGGLIFAGLGVAQALAFATLRYQRIRFPDISSYPGALLNSTATAFIDEATFRGAIFGTLLTLGLEANLANVMQALLYTLTTRLGAPGGPLPAGPDPRHRPHRRLADRRHGRHRRRVPRPRRDPLRCVPGHRPHRPDLAEGREARRSTAAADLLRAGASSGPRESAQRDR